MDSDADVHCFSIWGAVAAIQFCISTGIRFSTMHKQKSTRLRPEKRNVGVARTRMRMPILKYPSAQPGRGVWNFFLMGNVMLVGGWAPNQYSSSAAGSSRFTKAIKWRSLSKWSMVVVPVAR